MRASAPQRADFEDGNLGNLGTRYLTPAEAFIQGIERRLGAASPPAAARDQDQIPA